MAMKITKDDKVVVITGKDKGKEGKVMQAMPEKGKVIVSGVNVVTKHQKARNQQNPGRTHQEGSSYRRFQNVMVVCKKCGKATRVAMKFEGDKKVRVCKKCGATLEK